MRETGLYDKVLDGAFLTIEEGMALFGQAPLADLMFLANELRMKAVPHGKVTWQIDRNVNTTNVCIANCKFCNFYRVPGHPEAYITDMPIYRRKIEETLRYGGDQLLLQGGHHPQLGLDFYTTTFRQIKQEFPDLTIDSLNFHINDYSILTSVYGERIDGIIGYSVLSRYILKVDYDSSRIEFWTKGSMRYPRGGFLLRPLINTLPVQTARVKDDVTINSRFLFDMGAGLNMMLTTDFIKDSALLHKKRKFFIKQAEGLGGKIDMTLTVIREIKIGPYRFRNVPIYIFDDKFNVTSYPYLGGLIGNDLLRRFNVILNYERRDIYLLPNSHYNEPFDYSYTGIELFLENGQIVLGDVAKGSPAEAAGLKEGDVVVAINKNFAQNLQQYKIALQTTGDRLKIIVQRDDELKEFEMKVRSIL